MSKPKTSIGCELWSINKWLRYTGWRLYVEFDPTNDDVPTRIGFNFWGWKDL